MTSTSTMLLVALSPPSNNTMKFIQSLLIALFLGCLTFAPSLALAQGAGAASADPTSVTLQDPLQLSADAPLEDLVARVIKSFLGIVGIIALILFLYGGILWLTSAGNSSKVEEGRNVFVWAVLGLVVIFSSYVIVTFVFDRLTTTS